MKTIFYTFILSFVVITVSAQETTEVKGQKGSANAVGITSRESARLAIQRQIKFTGNSKTEEITIDVPAETKRFTLDIIGEVVQGKFNVEVIDPDGNKQGNFSLSTQLPYGSERVNGHFEKFLNDPQSGTWIIRILSTKAEGEIHINSSFVE